MPVHPPEPSPAVAAAVAAAAAARHPDLVPSPEDVQTLLDLRDRIEAYLDFAIGAWLDHTNAEARAAGTRTAWHSPSLVRIEWWDSQVACVSYMTPCDDQTMEMSISMADLIPEFAARAATLAALTG